MSRKTIFANFIAPKFGGSNAAPWAGRDELCAYISETEYTLMT